MSELPFEFPLLNAATADVVTGNLGRPNAPAKKDSLVRLMMTSTLSSCPEKSPVVGGKLTVSVVPAGSRAVLQVVFGSGKNPFWRGAWERARDLAHLDLVFRGNVPGRGNGSRIPRRSAHDDEA